MKQKIASILDAAKENGWVLEPDAKALFRLAGFDVPRSALARSGEEALAAAREIGWPVVAKVVSPSVIHKSDIGGVVTGIVDEAWLSDTVSRLRSIEGCESVLVEETVSGLELIVGGTIDPQFGPTVLFGMGGVGVEIYRDTAIRMAPVGEGDVEAMIGELRARRLIEGYRGSAPVDRSELIRLVVRFSELLVEIGGRVSSIDLNPVICTRERCVVADARIILAGGPQKIR